MERTRNRLAADITEGSIARGMLLFFMPLLLGTLLQQFYAAIDSVILGQYVGKTALAAVGGSCSSMVHLLVGLFGGLSAGPSVLLSQYYGAQEEDRMKKCVQTAISLALALGLLLTVLGLLATDWFLQALDTPTEIMQYSKDYLLWYFVGLIPSIVYNMGAGLLRAIGDTKRPLYFLILCVVLNTGLDLLFVAVLKMEVAGAAIATSLSQLVCAVLILRTLSRLPEPLKLSLRSLQTDFPMLGKMLAIGVPAGLQSSMYNVANLIIQKAINLLGTNAIAAWAAFLRLDGFYFTIAGSLGLTVTTFVGQNYGAKKLDRIKQTNNVGMLLYVGYSVILGLLLCVLREPLMHIFCEDADVIKQGMDILMYIAPFYVLFAPTEIFSSAMRGVGNSIRPTIISAFTVCVLRMVILFGYTFSHLSNLSIAICFPITWFVSSLVFTVYYYFGKWMPHQKHA
ncbi:MAG: MATE family efflux transporter [Oscillospiraceae bacterium]|nr:MATE family efflux transporter [Oscillospiraceae bacterium]